jgi:hypothetical protein
MDVQFCSGAPFTVLLSSRGYEVYMGSNYKYITGPIWLDSLSCPEDASTATECSNDGWGVHDCSHSEDLYLSCFGGLGTNIQRIGYTLL